VAKNPVGNLTLLHSNAQGCWNWYDTRSGRAQGEVGAIDAAIDQVCLLQPVDPDRIALAGFSAGAGMAARRWAARVGAKPTTPKVIQHLDLNRFCAIHQTNVILLEKILDRQSLECRIQIVAVHHSLVLERLHSKIAGPVT